MTPDLFLTIVESEMHPGTLSVRIWSEEEGRLSATRLKERLKEAGYKPGDIVRLSLERRSYHE